MSKNLKISFLLCFILSVVVIAWHTLANFFAGVGLNYVAILVVIASLLFIVLFDKHTYSRVKDLFFICCVFAFLETIVYFPCEFGGCQDASVATVFFNFQNVYAVLGLLFLAYLAFRFITESKNIRISFVEILLGNEKPNKEKKEKKSKELSNGSLEEKPNAEEKSENKDETIENNEETIIIQDEEKSEE